MNNKVIRTGAIIGFLTVVIGAFGAHGLKATLEMNGTIETFETGVLYQAIHCFAILFTGLMYQEYDSKGLNRAFYSFVVGVVVFSGSLYVLSITGLKVLGAITPIGGVGFLLGWMFLFIAANKKRDAR